MTQNGWIAVIVGVVIIGAGAWWFTSRAPATSDDGTPVATDVVDDANTQPTPTAGSGTGATVPNAAMTASVSYNGSTFSPSTVTIARGGTVTFTSTGPSMWVASGPHPEHTGYDGTTRAAHCVPGFNGTTAFDQCSGGQSYSFTFSKTGTWTYHNHLNASAFGKVVVVE